MRKMYGRFSRLPVVDRIGLALVAIWILWAVTAAAINGRLLSPLSPYVVAPVMLVVGVAAGRQVADRFAREWVDDPRPAGVAVAAVSTFFIWEIIRGGAGGGPLGYANANAALAVQGLALIALGLVNTRGTAWRYLVLAFVGLVATAAVICSRAGLALTVPVLAVILLAVVVRLHRRWWTGIVTLLGAGAVGVAGMGNVWLAATPGWPSWAEIAFDSARRQLWSDAFRLWQRHPLTGGGPGAFRDFSALAADPDTATAHSSLLQVAAETGVIGAVLFAALIVLGYGLTAQGHPRRAVIGVAAWSALAIHSFVDHLLEFSLIVLAAGLVLGWAGRLVTSEQLDVGEGESPVLR